MEREREREREREIKKKEEEEKTNREWGSDWKKKENEKEG